MLWPTIDGPADAIAGLNCTPSVMRVYADSTRATTVAATREGNDASISFYTQVDEGTVEPFCDACANAIRNGLEAWPLVS
jgi:hypothetical protein